MKNLLMLFLIFSLSITNSQQENALKKYIPEGNLEEIIFYVREKDNSNEHFARSAQILKRDNAKANIIICHGFMCDKRDISFLRSIFKNFNIITFDFRAHGQIVIDDQYCTFGKNECHEVMGITHYIKSREDLKSLPTFVYGFSMGAVAAIMAQAKDPNLFDAGIYDCPFESSELVLKRGLDNLKFNVFGYEFHLPGRTFLYKYAYHPIVQSILKITLKTIAKLDATEVNTCICPVNPMIAIRKFNKPSFFIVCRNDDKAPIEAVKKVYNGAKGYKRLWITNGRRHFDSFFWNPEKYVYKINAFYEKIIDKSYLKSPKSKILEDAPDSTAKKNKKAEIILANPNVNKIFPY